MIPDWITSAKTPCFSPSIFFLNPGEILSILLQGVLASSIWSLTSPIAILEPISSTSFMPSVSMFARTCHGSKSGLARSAACFVNCSRSIKLTWRLPLWP